MHESKRNIKRRIDEMEGRDLKGAALEEFHILTDTYKNILKIEMLEGGGYSGDESYESGRRFTEPYAERGGRNRGRSYDGDGSYERGGFPGGSYDGGNSSRRGRMSYDEGKSEIAEEIEHLMRKAKPEEREALARCLKQLD